jgi:hypothetical protein
MNKPAINYVVRWHLGEANTKDAVITLPLRVYSPLNGSRGHWAADACRRKKQRHIASWACGGPLAEYRAGLAKGYVASAKVTITRIAPRELDDDNAIAGCKSIRDGIADALGVDDRDNRLTWAYSQERGKPKEYAVRITVMGRAA